MDASEEHAIDQPTLLDQSDIQPPTSQPLSLETDTLESVNESRVNLEIVKGDLSADNQRGLYIDYLLHWTLPEDPKLQSKIRHEAWLFEVIQDSNNTEGYPQQILQKPFCKSQSG